MTVGFPNKQVAKPSCLFQTLKHSLFVGLLASNLQTRLFCLSKQNTQTHPLPKQANQHNSLQHKLSNHRLSNDEDDDVLEPRFLLLRCLRLCVGGACCVLVVAGFSLSSLFVLLRVPHVWS